MTRKTYTGPTASPRLVSELGIMAWRLRMSPRTIATTPGDSIIFKELGVLLGQIARGAPASKVFRQDQKRKPKRDNRHAIAVIYYFFRATGKTDAEACDAVRSCPKLKAPSSSETIRKYAQINRESALQYLEDNDSFATQLAIFHSLYPDGTDPNVDKASDALTNSDDIRRLVDAYVPRLSRADLARFRKHIEDKSGKSAAWPSDLPAVRRGTRPG